MSPPPNPTPGYSTVRMIPQSFTDDADVAAGGAGEHELGQVQEDRPRAG